MKLIDILVEELPKRGGWPGGAAFVAQEEGGWLWSFTSKPQKDCDDEWMDESSSGYHNKVGKLPEASDHDTSSITREQYEAALAAKNDGWIEWGGGDCPVDGREMVDVIFGRGGRMSANIADCWRWSHDGTDSDIIAYRLHKPQEAEHAKADDEADLNECIGQTPVPAWNGDGLPPVGCKCEYLDRNNGWYPVTIKYASNQIVVICGMTNILGDKQETEIAKDVQLDKPQFRPLLTESERKRKEAIEEMIKIATIYTTKSLSLGLALNSIYNAIAAGEITGMKLED